MSHCNGINEFGCGVTLLRTELGNPVIKCYYQNSMFPREGVRGATHVASKRVFISGDEWLMVEFWGPKRELVRIISSTILKQF